MNAAEMVGPTAGIALSWAEICGQHPDEWVCLVEVEHQPDGQIRSATVVAHHRSLKWALQQVELPCDPRRMVAHTGGRTLRFPRIELSDEIRDIIRARR